jgi:WD40 repeat protein
MTEFWLNVGTDPMITSLQASLAEMLDSPRAFENAEAGRIYLSKQLAKKACLIILDDVWNAEDVRALFSNLGRNCRILITTRDAGIITALGAREYRLDLLTAEESLELLALWAGKDVSDLPDEAAQIVQECGRLPLALTLCGALARDEVPWNDLLEALKDASLKFLDHPQGSVMRSMKVSVERLTPEERDCYLKLAVFPPDEAVPEATILTLWCYKARLKERDARRIISALSRKALLKRSETAGRSVIELHDLQHDYLRNVRSDLQGLHRLILDAYKNKTSQGRWHTGPDDGYFFQHLAYHLCHAGRHDCLKALLIDFDWMQARIRSTDVTGLIHDYDFVSSQDEIRDVQGAIRLSAHVLLSDPGQLPSQLMGRLKDHESQKVQSLLGQIPGKVLGPWIRPLSQSLTPPGGPLIQTLEGHADWVNAVAVTPDGSRAISGSDDRTLKVWDLESGRAVQTLEGHARGVNAVAVTPDGSLAISGSYDGTLKVWELESGRAVQTLEGHADWVSAVSVTPDGSLAISGSDDGTLKVWELESGRAVQTLEGHAGPVWAVAVTPDGSLAISGSDDGTLKVWELESGRAVQTLEGHARPVSAVAVTPDGSLAISGSDDGTLKVWELESGRAVQTRRGSCRPGLGSSSHAGWQPSDIGIL